MFGTILITGGAGFIGGCFIRQVVAARKAKVVNLDALTYASSLAALDSVHGDPSYAFVKGDIRDGATLAGVFREHHPDAVVHFAAETHVDRSIDDPRAFVETNIRGTFELLMAARTYWDGLDEEANDRFRFLHVSTDEVFGSLGATGRFTEATAYDPRSPYSASKAASDHLVRSWHHTFGLPSIVTNCSNNYGPYQFPEKLIPLMILNAVEGRALPVYGDGGNVRDWLFVEDHCRALRMILEGGRPGQTYNIGGDSERTNLQVVDAICDVVDELRPTLKHSPCRSLKTFVPDRPGHDRRYAMDSSKLRRELNWRPEVDFETGLSRTVRWYLENPDWVAGVLAGRYDRERVGLGES